MFRADGILMRTLPTERNSDNDDASYDDAYAAAAAAIATVDDDDVDTASKRKHA